MRWGVEVFYRSLKQTLEKRRMLSRTPEAARCELTWAVFAMWLLGLMTVASILARGGDPLRWSAARTRDRMRCSMRRALSRRHQDRA
jgi:IS4 transposase